MKKLIRFIICFLMVGCIPFSKKKIVEIHVNQQKNAVVINKVGNNHVQLVDAQFAYYIEQKDNQQMLVKESLENHATEILFTIEGIIDTVKMFHRQLFISYKPHAFNDIVIMNLTTQQKIDTFKAHPHTRNLYLYQESLCYLKQGNEKVTLKCLDKEHQENFIEENAHLLEIHPTPQTLLTLQRKEESKTIIFKYYYQNQLQTFHYTLEPNEVDINVLGIQKDRVLLRITNQEDPKKEIAYFDLNKKIITKLIIDEPVFDQAQTSIKPPITVINNQAYYALNHRLMLVDIKDDYSVTFTKTNISYQTDRMLQSENGKKVFIENNQIYELK